MAYLQLHSRLNHIKIYPEKFNTIHSSTTATGISSSSEHKDLAFDALAKIMTDEN